MTEIWNRSGDAVGLSIQVYEIKRVSLGAGSSGLTDITLDRQGRFLSASVTPDGTGVATEASDIGVMVSQTDNAELDEGDLITAIRVHTHNAGVGVITVGFHIVVFIRY